jgi:hypothetical protein
VIFKGFCPIKLHEKTIFFDKLKTRKLKSSKVGRFQKSILKVWFVENEFWKKENKSYQK